MTGTRRNKYSYGYAIAIENPTAPGTYIAPTTDMPVDSFPLDPNITDSEVKVCTGDLGDRVVYREKAEPGGTMKGWAWPERSLDELLLLAFGKVTTTRNIASTGLSYTHEYEQDNSKMLTASLTKWAKAITGATEPAAYPGAMLKSLTIGYDGPGPISLEAEWLTNAPDFSISAPTLTKGTSDFFVWGNFQAELDGVASGQNVKASIKFDLATDAQYGDDGNYTPNIKTFNDWNVSGTLEWPKTSNDELREYITGSTTGNTITSDIADHRLKLSLTGSTIETDTTPDPDAVYKYGLIFKMPWIQYKPLQSNSDSDTTETFTASWVARKFEGTDAGLGTNKICSATLVDKQAVVMPSFS